MNEKEKFEDIIESKFSEAEFPFDENNWDGAEEMISSFRKKEKIKRFGLIFLSGIAIGVLVMFPFVNKVSEKTNNDFAKIEKGSTIESQPIALNDNIQPESNELTAGGQNKGLTESESKVDERINNENLSSTNSSENGNIEEVTSSNKVGSKKRKANKGIHFGSPVHNSLSSSFKHAKANHEQENTSAQETENVSTSPSELAPNGKLVLFSKLNKNQITTIDSLAHIDHLLEAEKVITNNKPVFIPKWNYSAAFGANCVNHFSVNPYQGLEVSRSVSPKVEVGTGAYYTYLTVLSNGVKAITTHTTYDFGYQSDITEIKTNKLHYIVIPVYAKYNINDKNTVLAGTNIYALFTSSNSLTTYKESYGEKQNVASKKAAGYSNGINNYDIGLFAGYKRNLFGNLGAAIYFNYGLKDIKKNDYYNINKFERNISGQFMVTYKL